MPNIKSKVKSIKKIEKRTKRNRIVKEKVKLAIKNARIAGEAKAKNTKELVSLAHKEINKSVSKGVYKKNNGARKSSRLDAYIKLVLNS